MDVDDSILTFRAPAREPGRVDACASPVLELAYAGFFVTKRGVPPGPGAAAPSWFRRFAVEAPETLGAVAAFWADHGLPGSGAEAFVLAIRYGYARDPNPERFLRDVPGLAARYLAEGTSAPADAEHADVEHVAERIALLREPAAADAWVAAHRGLWRLVGPVWERDRHAAVNAAVTAALASVEAGAGALAALPPHHFAQFEHAAMSIRQAETAGRVLLVPLGMALAGGFVFDVDGTVVIGFGLQADEVHEVTARRVAHLAPRMKAFGDPTRAMLLALIARFEGLQLTVGDLAQQLGVSQPTVSGHLRLLRDAGLIELERRGNKAHHRVDREALHRLLSGFETAVLEGADSDNGGAGDEAAAAIAAEPAPTPANASSG